MRGFRGSAPDALANQGRERDDEALRKRAAVAAYDITCLPLVGRPEQYDFEKLVARLKERMPQLASG